MVAGFLKMRNKKEFTNHMSSSQNNEESKGRVTLARARELLGDKDISDEELEKVLENLRTYCGIVYDVYKKVKQEAKENGDTINTIPAKEVNKNSIKDAA